jgi:glutaminyl-tRNA synthetase
MDLDDMTEPSSPKNFIREIIRDDVAHGRQAGQVVTRFPPEPNGYLHIGHAKAISVDFGAAAEFGGRCHLRFDDTNPVTEDTEYVDAIRRDIEWLGYDWGEHLYFASDYFSKLYEYAVQLIRDGKAYVDSLTSEEIREYRGNFYNKGKNSPYRDRSVEDNLDLFERMKSGEFADGEHVLRAKIDMHSTNLNLRDPPLYRIRKTPHHRTGDAWCIYPMYDYAHAVSDAIEGITHSLCSLEFEDHRPLYDWCVAQLRDRIHADFDHDRTPRQIEFARLELGYMITSKRRLRKLIEDGHVDGWDDPRMPTLAGMRRRGFTPEAIRNLCERVGVSKRDGVIDISLFEHAVREHLNAITPRVMGVLRPLEVVIENFPEGHEEVFDAPLHPEDPSYGTREVKLTRTVYIERDDFREDAPKKWFRLAPGREIRLRYACLITCTGVEKDDSGEVVRLRAKWDSNSRGGTSPDGRRVRGTSHWVSKDHAVPAEARIYDRLFSAENPLNVEEGQTYIDNLNPNSLEVLSGARVEPYLASAEPGQRFQFERIGYFCVDGDSSPGGLVFNRTISLRDSWAKLEKGRGRRSPAGGKP